MKSELEEKVVQDDSGEQEDDANQSIVFFFNYSRKNFNLNLIGVQKKQPKNIES